MALAMKPSKPLAISSLLQHRDTRLLQGRWPFHRASTNTRQKDRHLDWRLAPLSSATKLQERVTRYSVVARTPRCWLCSWRVPRHRLFTRAHLLVIRGKVFVRCYVATTRRSTVAWWLWLDSTKAEVAEPIVPPNKFIAVPRTCAASLPRRRWRRLQVLRSRVLWAKPTANIGQDRADQRWAHECGPSRRRYQW